MNYQVYDFTKILPTVQDNKKATLEDKKALDAIKSELLIAPSQKLGLPLNSFN